MHYHLAICDDEPQASALLSRISRDWAAASGHSVQIDSFPSAEAFLFHYAEDKSYDILLLDIEMGAMNGVALAKNVRRENREVQIIFVTGFSDYIAFGYEVEALHYLMKPVSREKLVAVFDRAAEKLRRNERALLLALSGEAVRVPFYEIAYLEVRQNYVTVHACETYTVKKPLSELERQLDDGFFRAGRSYLINLRFVRKVTKTDVFLKNGAVIPLPRGMYEPLNRAIIRYF